MGGGGRPRSPKAVSGSKNAMTRETAKNPNRTGALSPHFSRVMS